MGTCSINIVYINTHWCFKHHWNNYSIAHTQECMIKRGGVYNALLHTIVYISEEGGGEGGGLSSIH